VLAINRNNRKVGVKVQAPVDGAATGVTIKGLYLLLYSIALIKSTTPLLT